MAAWEKEEIELEGGAKALAQMPVIVSASRATDIPAFYADWFMARLKAGYVKWLNPFSGVPLYVGFRRTRCIVFWSKNPVPMIPRLDALDAICPNYYFQFTLNDYEAEGIEPRVPPLADRIETFRRLSERVGRERVVWRFDPLLLTEKTSIDTLLERVGNVGRQLKGFTEKLVFSFIDIADYRKVQRNLAGLGVRELSAEEQTRFARGLAELNRELGLVLATCGEASDLSAHGVVRGKCVDDELMVRLFCGDAELMDFIGAERDMLDGWRAGKPRKDGGQRRACGCVASKDIGEYCTCPHLCRYCYANASGAAALANWRLHCASPRAETIAGR